MEGGGRRVAGGGKKVEVEVEGGGRRVEGGEIRLESRGMSVEGGR